MPGFTTNGSTSGSSDHEREGCEEQHFGLRLGYAGLHNQRFDVGVLRPRASPWKA
uniref:Uncharacterized protein n=1 Tax=Leersia perrieri TaxID=77586 RepID=A0A0D9WFW2_9ORYZ